MTTSIAERIAGSQSASSRAIRSIREMIDHGHLAEGEKLPSERALAKLVEVSRPTIRSALKDLRKSGVILPRKTRGWVVSAAHGSARPLAQAIGVISITANTDGIEKTKTTATVLHILAGIMDAITTAGTHAILLQPDRLGKDAESLISAGLRGVVATYDICENPATRDLITGLIERGVAVVGQADGLSIPGMDTVVSDHSDGAAQLVAWLRQNGRKKILRVWHRSAEPHRPSWLALRDAGYEKACRDTGIGVLPPLEIVCPMLSFSEADFRTIVRLTAGYLAEAFAANPGIDAIMAISDSEAMWTLAALRILGKQPNRDVVVVGYDNYWADSVCLQWEPALPAATVDKKNTETGRMIVSLLLDRINGRLPAPAQQRVAKPELVVIPQKKGVQG